MSKSVPINNLMVIIKDHITYFLGSCYLTLAIQLTLFPEQKSPTGYLKGDYFHSLDLSVPWTWSQALDIMELSHHSPSRHGLSFQSFLSLFMASKATSILCLLVNCQVEGNNARHLQSISYFQKRFHLCCPDDPHGVSRRWV